MYTLHIANKNYSSWSLRPWILLKALDIPFTEISHLFGEAGDWQRYKQTNPTGLVPCLLDDEQVVWDSLAIVEYIYEDHPRVWPPERATRAWARSVVAEMHSGLTAIRQYCSMSCGIRVKLNVKAQEAIAKDVERIEQIWSEGLAKFGGPYLAGSEFTAVDAFYAPVVFRFLTYGIELSPAANAYMQRMLEHPAM